MDIQGRKLIKIATAGSVDDGKSTLIGRLLYDTHSLTTDKIEAIEKNSKQRGYDYLDFSLATDGLVAEREQGITIDVAHIYFNTSKTNFIVADTPGHVEYTRNMVTGASTSQVAIILIDARKGVIEQTYRHFFISNLLRMSHVVVAVNKMDLVDYSEEVFQKIKSDFDELVAKSDFTEDQITFIPVSALKGENVTCESVQMPWYVGNTLLDHLEVLEPNDLQESTVARFPVQYVVRPKTEAYHDFRGFSGKLYGNSLKVGDKVALLPSGNESTIKGIHFFDQELKEAAPGASITITLEDEVDCSRGDMIVKVGEEPISEKSLTATLCQVNSKALKVGQKYILQHGVNRVLAKVDRIEEKIHADFSGKEEAEQLKLNDIGRVQFRLSKPIHVDSYKSNKSNGSFILIDEGSFDTISVGFID
ncbi:sulfate adenylyltransferase subunit 1 [Algoriphagus zhangzhouensis]|uniref:sulfate adenylyltransferase n=1 Tax=Algoriphagus zhangzhouensis TaxID=1073327 RepID=A0A1M7Z9R5_9BACT|nr:GTP-binding protein [Algoriphagus zhangzhouensis]TDY47351.1 sulfate adenylyltransferase subunit 1 [Algoriphagus zhangzhouensis]SHO61614.1 sulfate adenylyltransferase subunit 1 [Algoriphagus zhangzhouensis]